MVYREVDGAREHLYYTGELAAGLPVYPAHTLDPAKAYVFTAGNRYVYSELYWYLDSGTPYVNMLIPGLDWGSTYYLEEISPPEGYLAPDAPLVITNADAHNNGTAYYNMNVREFFNERDPKALVITKSDKSASEDLSLFYNLPGADFVLVKEENGLLYFLTKGGRNATDPATWSLPITRQAYDSIVADFEMGDTAWQQFHLHLAQNNVYTTNSKGTAVVYPGEINADTAQYILIETKAPRGYEIGEPVQTVVNKGEALPAVQVFNKAIPGTIFIQKTDKSGQLQLKGAQFIITYSERTPDGYSKNYYLANDPSHGGVSDFREYQGWTVPRDLVYRFETDALGKVIISNLPAGTYDIREIMPPPGYAYSRELSDSPYRNDLYTIPVKEDGTAGSVYRFLRNNRLFVKPFQKKP